MKYDRYGAPRLIDMSRRVQQSPWPLTVALDDSSLDRMIEDRAATRHLSPLPPWSQVICGVSEPQAARNWMLCAENDTGEVIVVNDAPTFTVLQQEKSLQDAAGP